MLDLLIRNGWVIDGAGNPAYPADVAVEGDRIAAVERLPGAQAQRIIEARGKIVCPGLIDAHSHTDGTIRKNPLAQSTIRQGITTEIVGNCGGTSGVLRHATFAEHLEEVARTGTSCNLGWLIGHNTLRQRAGVSGSEYSEEQARAMEDGAREALASGALGLSTGLEFEPGRNATTDEIVRVARVAGGFGALYVSHIRNRDARLQEAIDEFLEIVRRSDTAGQVSHLNVRHNTGAAEGAWERAVASLEAARGEGLHVLTDCTPFREGIGQLAAILPPWLKAEGPARAAEMLGDPAVRSRVRGECDRYWRFIHRGEWQRVIMVGNPHFPELAGLRFSEIAARWGKDPWDACFDILAAYGGEMDGLHVIGELMTDELLRAMSTHPLFMLTVDGYSSIADPEFTEAGAHPIHFAGMTHYLTHHVRERGWLRLEEAIRKMTSMPATHFGLRERGLLRRGQFADVMVFDYAALDDVSTRERPAAYVRGVEHVLVNGEIVIADGEHTGARPGRNLLRAG